MNSPDHPSNVIEAAQKTLDQLGVSDVAALSALFAGLEDGLRADLESVAASADSDAVEALRVRWLGRKQGVIRGVTDNWLKSAPPELKRETGQRLNALRQYAEQ